MRGRLRGQEEGLTDIVLQSEAFKRASAPLTRAENVVPKREGFFLEVAGAFAWDFAGAAWDAQKFRKRAIWVTPSYASGGWAALGCFATKMRSQADEDAVDWGGRRLYSASNYAVSLEYRRAVAYRQRDADTQPSSDRDRRVQA